MVTATMWYNQWKEGAGKPRGKPGDGRMAYGIDLDRIPLTEYQKLLTEETLLPGRRMLLDNLEQNFLALQRHGIATVLQLRKALCTPQKIGILARQSGLTEEYLNMLRRESGSMETKPVALADFPKVDVERIASLAAAGITTSLQYLQSVPKEKDELYCLCDLARVNGIGAVAARMFCEAGYRSAEDVANADEQAMLQRVTQANANQAYYKGKLGIKDMRFCIEYAKLLIRYAGQASAEEPGT